MSALGILAGALAVIGTVPVLQANAVPLAGPGVGESAIVKVQSKAQSKAQSKRKAAVKQGKRACVRTASGATRCGIVIL